MKRSAFIVLLIVAVVLGSAIGGALAGGIAIGKSQGRQEASQGLLSQFSQSSSTTGQGNNLSQGNNTVFTSGLGTVGTVEKIEGNVITLRTTTGTVTVNIGNSTLIQKTQQGSLADISTGESVAVSGSRNTNGSIDARSITVTSSFTRGAVVGQ